MKDGASIARPVAILQPLNNNYTLVAGREEGREEGRERGREGGLKEGREGV